MSGIRKIYPIALLLLLSVKVAAQQPYDISSLGLKEGLSNNHVVSIAQDKRGFLWFATEDGLNFFDGIRFIPYYKAEESDDTSITGNELNCIMDDPADSTLWICTQRAGLNAYHYGTDRFTAYRHDDSDPNSLITDDITKVIGDGNGGLWVTTYWKGIDHFDKATSRFTHYNTSTVPGMGSNHIWSVADGGDGNLYIGHVDKGFSILSVKERRARNYVHDPHDPHSLPGNEVMCVYRDVNGNIWVGTDNGLALFNPETNSFIRYTDPAGRLRHRIYDLHQFDNKLWIAMEFGGIAILDLSQHIPQQQRFMPPYLYVINEGDDGHGLSNSSIRCLFQDSFGNIWAGSWGGGIDFIRRDMPLFNAHIASPFPSTGNNLSSKIASSVCIDRDRRLWIGTNGGGINLFDHGQRKAIYNFDRESPTGNTVQASLCDSQGGLWFGLFFGGIVALNPTVSLLPSPEGIDRGDFKPFPLEEGSDEASAADVRSFFEDVEAGVIYVGTSNGIYLIDRDRKRVMQHHDKENNLVRSVVKASNGNIWVGFYGSGLGLYDSLFCDKKLFNVQSRFPSNTINHIFEDSRHRLWVATGEGLVCFPDLNDTTYTVYQRRNGLANAHIQAITEDRDGNIWVSTNCGISCLIDGGTIKNYDYHDNVPMGSFCRGSVARGPDGDICFGSINGLCFFSPEYVLQERKAPKALITDVENYTPNSLCIRFGILNYALVSQVEYAYRLRGLDDAWQALAGNSVTFRNLPYGKYRLQVRTRLRNQLWSGETTSTEIRITPPLWLTWWAKTIYVLMGAAILFFIIHAYNKRLYAESLYKVERQRHEHEQELNNERLRFYTNITHELRTPLTLIIGPLEDLQRENTLPQKERQTIDVIHQSALRLLALINQLLEFRKIETQNKRLSVSRGNIVALVRETAMKYRELNRNHDVEICLDIQQPDITIYFDREVMQMILDNLITNAMKYTPAGNITVGVGTHRQDDTSVTEIYVSDTGHGIKPEAVPYIFDRYYQEQGLHQASGTGIGLSLVKSLVALHKGKIFVESTPEQGSRFTVQLPNGLPQNPPSQVELKKSSPLGEDLGEAGKLSEAGIPILLVVEDNPDICDYVSGAFADSFEVSTAHDGKAGLEAALRLIPDIIVSDIMMPQMDGVTLCSRLKKDVRTSHIPIILLTAKDTLSDKETGYQAGADSYITKPFSAGLLRSRIDNLLQQRANLARHFIETLASPDSSLRSAEVMYDVSAGGRQETAGSGVEVSFLQKINHLIEERLSLDKIDINYLSDKMCMSSSTLYRKMKALTGLSTNEYVRKVRMKYALQYLLEGRYSVSEIAFKVGFSNLLYFRQCFKEEYGCTPSDYLKQSQR